MIAFSHPSRALSLSGGHALIPIGAPVFGAGDLLKQPELRFL
jgi:hypothetical protein